jgi:hypothetical protein
VHDARRTCASLFVDLYVHPRVAMQILRHADFSITMEVYTQVSSRQTRDALKRLGDSLEHLPSAANRCHRRGLPTANPTSNGGRRDRNGPNIRDQPKAALASKFIVSARVSARCGRSCIGDSH